MINKFSLLVPCYNAENYILPFLENINKLNRQFDEVIFYDDCSTDNSVKILKENNQKVIIGNKNMGPSYARNILARNSSYDWFHFHDIDDMLDADYLHKVGQIILLKNNDVILCNVDWLNSDCSKTLIKWRYKNYDINKNCIEYTLKNPIGGINGLYKKSTFLKINGFDEKLLNWEDSDLHVMLAINGAKFHIIEEVLSYSIRREYSQSANQIEAWKYRLLCLKKYYPLFNSNSIEALGREFEKLLYIFIKNKQPEHLKQALAFTLKCGIKTPNSKIFKKLNLILPNNVLWALRIFHLKVIIGK